VESFVLGDGVSRIGESCFANRTALKSFSFTGNSSRVVIGKDAFSGCNNLSIVVPDDVQGIYPTAFTGVKKLTYKGDLLSLDDWGAQEFIS
jgi:hypothetical protein